jgi:aspartyl protease family protein
MSQIIKAAAVVTLASLGIANYLSNRTMGPKANHAASPAAATSGAGQRQPAASALMRSGASAILEQGTNGHYFAKVETRGVTLNMVVDTGASLVSLTSEDARKLGINPLPSEYTVRTMTANGEARAAPVKLDMVRIDGVLVYDVDAIVSQPGALGTSLLGMSFLKKLASYKAEQGRLVLHQ